MISGAALFFVVFLLASLEGRFFLENSSTYLTSIHFYI